MDALTLSAAEAIELIGADLKPETLREWARDGRIGFVKVGREVRFTPAHVKAYIAAHTTEVAPHGRSRAAKSRRARRTA